MITRYCLMNTLLRELRQKYNQKGKPYQIETRWYRRKELESLLHSFEHIEVSELHFCCHGPLWCQAPEEKWHTLVVGQAHHFLQFFSKQLKGKKIIVVQNDELVHIVLPLRDTVDEDIHIFLSHHPL